MSESSEQRQPAETAIIKVGVCKNKLHDDLEFASDSSKSSYNPKKQMIRVKGKQFRKVIPHPMPPNSDDTSEDEDMELLPDVKQIHIQPEDNESSVYGQDEQAEDDDESDEASSLGLSESGRLAKHKTPGKSKKKSPKKSIKSVTPKINPFNFYPEL